MLLTPHYNMVLAKLKSKLGALAHDQKQASNWLCEQSQISSKWHNTTYKLERQLCICHAGLYLVKF